MYTRIITYVISYNVTQIEFIHIINTFFTTALEKKRNTSTVVLQSYRDAPSGIIVASSTGLV